jgi:hypothetical protein
MEEPDPNRSQGREDVEPEHLGIPVPGPRLDGRGDRRQPVLACVLRESDVRAHRRMGRLAGPPDGLGVERGGLAPREEAPPAADAGAVPVVYDPAIPTLPDAGHQGDRLALGFPLSWTRSRTSRATGSEIRRSPRSHRASAFAVTPRRSASWAWVTPSRAR